MLFVDTGQISRRDKKELDNIYSIWQECTRQSKPKFIAHQLSKNPRRGQNFTHYAIIINDTNYLRDILSSGHEISMYDRYEDNFLHLACRLGSLESIHILLNYAPNLALESNSWGRLPIHNAVIFGRYNIVRYLIERFPAIIKHKDCWNRYLLYYATMVNNSPRLTDYLLSITPEINNIDSNDRTLFQDLVRRYQRRLGPIGQMAQIGKLMEHGAPGDTVNMINLASYGLLKKIYDKFKSSIASIRSLKCSQMNFVHKYSLPIQVSYMREIFHKKELDSSEILYYYNFQQRHPKIAPFWRKDIDKIQSIKNLLFVFPQVIRQKSHLSSIPNEIWAYTLSFLNQSEEANYQLLKDTKSSSRLK